MEETSRQTVDVDIACIGFGPATGGFLTTLSKALVDEHGNPTVQSSAVPGLPLQVVCYERADDVGFGVSGVVSRARSIKDSFPNFDLSQIPMTSPVTHEKVIYLLDPLGASKRSFGLKIADRLIRTFKELIPFQCDAVELPFIPHFMRKDNGFILSIGQFNQWVASQIAQTGAAQIWPGMAVREPLIENKQVKGIRLVDQGTDNEGRPSSNYMPGMDVHASLTVVGDGPVGAVGQALDRKFGLPNGHHQREWAVGMKMVIELPEDCTLPEGTVLHTLGFPEPEIFGFLYVSKDRLASLGIFVPSWFENPVRTAYRYLQHWMMHPYLWRYLKGGTLKSWGAKSLQESGKQGEPFLAGDGYARIGEGSGSTNVLTGSGVDEAWATGVLLAESVIELLKANRPFSKENLERTYVKARRHSWVEREGKIAEKARDGFHGGFISGLLGMALAGFTNGTLYIPGSSKPPHRRVQSFQRYFKGILTAEEIETLKRESSSRGVSLHDSIMNRAGWPEVPFDGKLLVSHQDALLMGGKVQAPAGYADHVVFLNPSLCEQCDQKVCMELCSAQAITPGEAGGVPRFDREKCIFCGACLWNCSMARDEHSEYGNIEFRAGAGGLHSSIN